MSWLVTAPAKHAELAERLRARLATRPILVLPGAFDGLSALVAREMGSPALYLSGAAYSASRGIPDAGIVTSSEVTDRVRDIVRATGLPLIVDIDTGYGSPLAAARAARELAEAGVAAVQIEDQQLPKACGHLEVQELATIGEAVARIQAIREATPSMVIVARTDARSWEGVAGVVRRATAFAEAGADLVFTEALRSAKEFAEVRAAVSAPLLANLTEFGKTPALTADELDRIGYTAAIFPVSALRVAAFAYRRLYQAIADSGTSASMLPEMLTRQELYDLLAYSSYAKFDSIVRGMLAVRDEPVRGGGSSPEGDDQ